MGFSVLEYDFHYNTVKYPRDNQLQLLFTHTDSLAYAVQTHDIYRDMADDVASRYDFRENPLELNSVPKREFPGLRPKCYAFDCSHCSYCSHS